MTRSYKQNLYRSKKAIYNTFYITLKNPRYIFYFSLWAHQEEKGAVLMETMMENTHFLRGCSKSRFLKKACKISVI